MGLDGEDGVAVEGREDDAVARVAQVFDDLFHLLADVLYLVVGLVVEERLDEVRKLLQFVYLIIYSDVAVQLLQRCGIFPVFRIFNDYFLAEDVALDSQTQQLHEEVLV